MADNPTTVVDVRIDYATWQEIEVEADRRMKLTNGHSFETILKTRCKYCGRKPDSQLKCGSWFHTYRHRLCDILQERGIIK